MPEKETYGFELGREMQAIIIRAAVAARRPIPALPGVAVVAIELGRLIEKQRAQTRLDLLMEILSAKAAESGRGLLLTSMAVEERRKLDRLTAELKGTRHGELEREGDESNESFYPPTKPGT